jgi:hypothetical protein
MDLKTISETVVEDCMKATSDPCRDNLTLLIVNLKDYYVDFKQNHHRRYLVTSSDSSAKSSTISG